MIERTWQEMQRTDTIVDAWLEIFPTNSFNPFCA